MLPGQLNKFNQAKNEKQFRELVISTLVPVSHPKLQAQLREEFIILFLKKFGPKTREQIGYGTAMTPATTINRLTTLTEQGMIRVDAPPVQQKRGRPKAKYSIINKLRPIEIHEEGIITRVIDPDDQQ